MSLALAVIKSVDWSGVQALSGTGDDVAEGLRSFLTCLDADEMPLLWRGLEGPVFDQTTIGPAAGVVVDVLVASLADERPPFVHAWTLEALRFILEGGSHADPALAERCLQRARQGTWTLAARIPRLDKADRATAIYLLDLLDPLAAKCIEST